MLIVAESAASVRGGPPAFEGQVRCLETFASPGAGRTLWVLEAPDREAAERALADSGAEAEQIWPATLHTPAPGPGAGAAPRQLVVVERRFEQPAEFAELQAREDRGAWCLELHGVRFLRTYFSADRRRMICLYDAPDAEAVRTAQRTIAMPLERVWPARASR